MTPIIVQGLMPCPFCGDSNTSDAGFCMVCDSCLARGPRTLVPGVGWNSRCNPVKDYLGAALELDQIAGQAQTNFERIAIERASMLLKSFAINSSATYRCSCCGTHEVEVTIECHNSACRQYARGETIHRGWESEPPTTDKED